MFIVLFVGDGCSFVVIPFISIMTGHWGGEKKER